MAKKGIYNPIKSYPYSDNRLLVVDWASLAYHQWHGMQSQKKNPKGKKPINSSEDEIDVWRNHMFSKMLKYIKLFNPIDIIFTMEGKDIWRKSYVEDYYNNNTKVYYDNTSYYIRYDNALFKLTKSNDEYIITKLDIIEDVFYLDLPYKGLGELPDRVKSVIWSLYLPNGLTPLIPSYKGNRTKQEWNFFTDKSIFKAYKEQFAQEIAGIFRAKCITISGAEGDDVGYVAIKYNENKYDSIILITRDSDFDQLLTQANLRIYNHETDQIVNCIDPVTYLETKILSGDSSDNINGMALPNSKNKLGEGTALKLLNKDRDVYTKAVNEGWDNQYRRNQTLIDLKYIPTHIQRTLCETIDSTKVELIGAQDIQHLYINDKLLQKLAQLKELGFYSVLSREYVDEHPDIFNPSVLIDEETTDLNNLIKPKRVFGDMNSVFDNPIDGDVF